MRMRAAWTEAVANLRRQPPVISLTMCGVATAVAFTTAATAYTASTLAEAELAAGGSVVVVSATSSEGLNMRECERMARLPFVTAVGGPYLDSGVSAITVVSGVPIAVVAVSPGALAVWDGQSHGDPVVGYDLASTLGMESGASVGIRVGSDVLAVGSVLPSTVPVSSLQSAIVIPLILDEPLSECWIAHEPGAQDAVVSAASATFAASPSAVGPYVRTNAGSLTATEYWLRFVSFRPWLLGAAAVGAVTAATAVFRRREVGVYRISGTKRRSVALIFGLEYIAPLVFVLPVGYSWGVALCAVAAGPNLDASAVLVAAAYVAALGGLFVPLATLIAVLVSRSNAFAALRDT
ncbi:hypothetical protein [Demequina sp.]|uniref:hypothetical protein n=1 Tax=Demequina sp. TaxID=2050685 RepID=UPI003D0AB95F